MAKTIEIEVKVDNKDAVDNVDKLNDGLEKTGQTAEKSVGGVKKLGTSFGALTKSLGIIGLIVTAFEVLKEALGKNQKVMDAVNIATTAIGIVFNDLFNFISDNFTPAIESITSAFADIPGTLVKLKDAIVNNIEVRFNALIDTFGLLGDAIKKVFSGDFTGALDSAGDAAKKFVDVQTGVENTVDRIVEGVSDLADAVGEYTENLIDNSKAIISNKQAGELLELQQTRIREASDRDAERQRQIRDDFTKSFAERIAANEELGRILEEQEIREKKTITDRIGALQAEQNQLGANFERRKEIFALQTELIAVEAQQEGFRSEQQVNRINLLKEEEDFKLAIKEKAQTDADAIFEKEVKASQKRSDDDVARAKLVEETKVGLVNATSEALLNNLEEGSNAAKGIAAAQILFDTYRGIQSTFASAAANPTSILFPAQPFIQAGAAALFGFGNLKKLLATSSAKASGSASAPSVSSPSSPASTSGLSQDALFSSGSLEAPNTETIGGGAGLNQQPVQAIVLESDITNTQNRINNYQERSEIG